MKRAIFWVACGDKYVDEARDSAARARRLMPDVDRVLLTDKSIGKGDFSQVVVSARGDGPWFLDNVRYYNRALELDCDRFIALDSDAYIISPVYDLFDVLDRFDFAGAHEGPRHTAKTVNLIPGVFCEFNIGVLALRNNAKVKALFVRWLDLYEKNVNVYGDNDQAPLREAIWLDDSDLQIHILPSEYNCRFHFGTWVFTQVKILHGGSRDIDKVARIVNKKIEEERVWEPKELLRI